MSRSSYVDAREAMRLCSLPSNQALGETLTSLADEDEDLTVVVSDYGRRLFLDGLVERHPEGFVQVGIAEQDQVSIGAALALEGFPVFAPCYASFVASRSFDQIRVNLGMMGAPLVLVGLSAGYDSADLGASHCATEDVALMRSVPTATVITPADNAELASAIRWLAAHPRPAYVRITGSMTETCLHASGCDVSSGGVTQLREGSDVALVACGQLAAAALEAADILETTDVSASVTEMSIVSQLREDELLRAVRGKRLVVTVEEHGVVGGLGSAVAEVLAERDDVPPLLALGTPRSYLDGGDVRQALLTHDGLDPWGIASRILERLERSKKR